MSSTPFTGYEPNSNLLLAGSQAMQIDGSVVPLPPTPPGTQQNLAFIQGPSSDHQSLIVMPSSNGQSLMITSELKGVGRLAAIIAECQRVSASAACPQLTAMDLPSSRAPGLCACVAWARAGLALNSGLRRASAVARTATST